MRLILPDLAGKVFSKKIVGPWPCEQCGELSQFAEMTPSRNEIFCRNPRCGFRRVVDKAKMRVLEPDGSLWEIDSLGRKRRVTGQ